MRYTAIAIAACLVMACPGRAWSQGTSSTAIAPSVERVKSAVVDAAERQEWSTLDRLLDQVDREAVRAAQADGMTALHWAVWHDELAAVRRLVQAGADVEATNRYGVRPLMLACTNGNDAIVGLLLAQGASANTKTADGQTVLMTAARTGSRPCVQQLLKHGAEVDAKERKGQTAIMWAAHEGHAGVVEELIQAGSDFRAALSSGFTPLLFAARQGHIDVARALIRAGANVDEVIERGKGGSGKSPRNGTSPLILAVENGHFEMASVLLDLGADPNDQRSGFTPLHTLTWVRKPNRGDGDDGDPAPTGSGRMTSLELVRVLKDRGADVNARLVRGASGRGVLNRTGATALLLAAHADDLPFVKLLVELGADPHITNADGCTALMAAAGIGVLAPGEEAGTEEEALATVEYLLGLGLAVNTVDKNGETAMHGAAYKSLPRMVEFLSDHGADPTIWNQSNKHGWTPLAIAQGHRPGNFKPHPETAAALERALR